MPICRKSLTLSGICSMSHAHGQGIIYSLRVLNPCRSLLMICVGRNARGRNRTGTVLRPRDFKSLCIPQKPLKSIRGPRREAVSKGVISGAAGNALNGKGIAAASRRETRGGINQETCRQVRCNPADGRSNFTDPPWRSIGSRDMERVSGSGRESPARPRSGLNEKGGFVVSMVECSRVRPGV
jgi:hypothetical protein